ncbi:Phosphoribosylformylglycinamidine cyclo-ligase [Sebaldella termitidis]|uniref:Phosphoribosylformylglycinamidine cyclo-ligase n=1 Tax=Sebaldella termitidis (strain ATCC 33386 / NCTC 11300) TaxID=526218 RepID=D1AK48_SEBTE|nr:phosphoribosylformylglycinamidine cyclo-ligase [Sebaldella termitidis]ACZ08964.1 phosphoribosylformylglycinamidine cyclo-ligase [Sebaldella termitidis ATCC 33386]SUI24283.1 Phosphoribosylformylglycinamidine cyclo-ligase [Sebaldella termitidis]
MLTYKNSGVDKEEGYKSVDMIKQMAVNTYSKKVLNELGSFGAMYKLGRYKNPVLVSGTDGVGTKLKLAFHLKKYDTIGIDCVAMCVNDILCHGAEPMFFLDYLACGKLDAGVSSEIVKGVAEGCLSSGMSLVGGETAEMPGFYNEGEYDIAGFAVGVVEKKKVINGEKIKEGDIIIGLESSGVHSNGFSLVRKLVTDLDEEYNGQKISEYLLTPTKIYVKPVSKIIKKFKVKGMAHITGGGLIENVPRVIPDGLSAVIYKDKIKVPEIFTYLQSKGVPEEEMWGTFNMGIGFIIVVKEKDKDKVMKKLSKYGENAYEIGRIEKGDNKICLK